MTDFGHPIRTLVFRSGFLPPFFQFLSMLHFFFYVTRKISFDKKSLSARIYTVFCHLIAVTLNYSLRFKKIKQVCHLHHIFQD